MSNQPQAHSPSKNDRTLASSDADRTVSIYHRNREQPTPDPNEPAINRIKFYLDRYRIKEALQIFFDENTLKLLHLESDFMWDIIPLICRRLRGLCQYRFRVFEGCERMLCRIAIDDNCNPKEVLISFLSEISQQEGCQDDNVFRAMIRPLEGTLLRMNSPSPRDENLVWVINSLMRHIATIELPQEYNLEGKKRHSLPNDASVKRFIEVLPLMLSFIEEFNERSIDYDKGPIPILTESQINEVLNRDASYSGDEDDFIDDDDLLVGPRHARSDGLDASVNALTTLMFNPLIFLDLTSQCPDLSLFANKCLNTLLRLRPSLFSPIYKRLYAKSNDQDHQAGPLEITNCTETTLSLANCSYIFRCEKSAPLDASLAFPRVITPEYLLISHLPYVSALLERSEILVHEKGLILLNSLFDLIAPNSLEETVCQLIITASILKQLFQIMVFSPLSSNRRKAYNLFIELCDLLNPKSKLALLTNVLSQTDLRPCVRAISIDQYRRFITTNKAPDSENFINFLDLCVKSCLPNSQHTDIIENYELILATLTFFRFLKLRKNQSIDPMEERYLSSKALRSDLFEPIRSAISIITAELKSHCKDMSNGNRKCSAITHNSLLDVTHSQSELGLLTRILGPKFEEIIDRQGDGDSEQIVRSETDCLNWALCRLDLVESVLVRTSELYDC